MNHRQFLVGAGFGLMLMTAGRAATAAEFHVSPKGDDGNPGTQAKPFATLEAARDAIRAQAKGEGATVQLHGGRYFRDTPFVLEPQDSGAAGKPVVYKAADGETPILDGGRLITGWKPLTADLPAISAKAKGNIWVADTEKGWKFCSLYVDGKLARRSRLINSDQWRHWPKNHKHGEPEKQGQLISFTGNVDFLEQLPSNGDAEMVCIIAQYGVMGNGVVTDVRSGQEQPGAIGGSLRWNSKQLNLRDSRRPDERGYNLENALSLIDESGEWAVDSAAGKVYYWPREGEDLATAEILAPRLYELIRLQGVEDEGPWVHHLEVHGLTLQYTDRLPEDRWPESWLLRQWENVDATVYVQGAHDCVFVGNRILRSGAYGVTLNHYAQRIRLEANEIGWTGSGGVFLEGYGPGTLDVNRDNVVVRNHIHDHGLANYWHSPSIQVYQSGHNRITHNLMQRSAYSSVSMVGMNPKQMNQAQMMFPGTWEGQRHVWAQFQPRIQDFPAEIVAKIKAGTQRFDRETMKPYMHSNKNAVEKNVVVEPHSLLNEGGAIYAWHPGKGNLWRENVIFISHAMPGSSILALDNLSEYFTVQKNVFWVNGGILDGVGARDGERGNLISDNHRVMFKPQHSARRKKKLGSWWHNHTGREKLDELFAKVHAEVNDQGGWPGTPEIGIPGIDAKAVLTTGPEMVLPEGSNVTIEE